MRDGHTVLRPPAAHARIRVRNGFEIDAYVIDAVRAGASGFPSKSIEPAARLDAIRTVAGGVALLSPEATQALLAEFATGGKGPVIPADILDALITREREMTTLAAHGLSNDLIAERLFLSPLTVKTHVNRAMMKAAAAHLANHARAVATAGSRRLAVRKGGLR